MSTFLSKKKDKQFGGVELAERIFNLMEKRNVNAAELSKATGIATSPISEWKKGKVKPSPDAIIRIADYFKVTTDYLLGRTDIEEPSFQPFLQKDDSDYMTVVDRILYWMKSTNTSGRALAGMLGMSHGVVTAWRKGKANPNIDAIVKISDVFGPPTDILLGRIPSEKQKADWKQKNEPKLKLVNEKERTDKGMAAGIVATIETLLQSVIHVKKILASFQTSCANSEKPNHEVDNERKELSLSMSDDFLEARAKLDEVLKEHARVAEDAIKTFERLSNESYIQQLENLPAIALSVAARWNNLSSANQAVVIGKIAELEHLQESQMSESELKKEPA